MVVDVELDVEVDVLLDVELLVEDEVLLDVDELVELDVLLVVDELVELNVLLEVELLVGSVVVTMVLVVVVVPHAGHVVVIRSCGLPVAASVELYLTEFVDSVSSTKQRTPLCTACVTSKVTT